MVYFDDIQALSVAATCLIVRTDPYPAEGLKSSPEYSTGLSELAV